MTKHTEGPWVIEPDHRVGSITITHESQGLRSHVAVLPKMTLCEEHGMIEANARLIAAAPDLLEALEALTEEAFVNMSGGRGHLIDDARAAIAKAKGE